jgi:EmrB/QacA subfamily drug resistance transporter
MTVTVEAPTETPYRWRWFALFVILAAEVMDLLDSLVTTIASPAIREDLGGSLSLIQWLGAAYTLAMAVGLLTGGRLGDMYGRRRMFIVGAVGFTVASAVCGLAPSGGVLIGARVVQGLLGAVMIPQGLGIIKQIFPPKEMAAAFGIFGPVMGMSSVGGPVLAGWLVDADWFGHGWRMIFLINLPLGLAAVLGALRFIPADSPVATRPRWDLTGMGLAAAGSLLLVYPLVQGRELDWPLWTFGMLAASVVLFVIFGWYEVRRERAGADPLVVPALFRKRAFTGGLVAGVVFFAALIGLSLTTSLYFQLGLGWSPLKAGLTGLPQALGAVIGFVAAGSGLTARLGRTLLQAGGVVMAAGAGVLWWTVDHVAGDVTPWHLAPALAVMGIGMGLFMAPFFDMVLAGVEPHESGSASGTLTAVQQLGGALGIAVLGTVLFGLLPGAVVDGADAAAPSLRAQLASAGVPAPDQERIVAGVRRCLRDRADADDPSREPASCAALTAAGGAGDPAVGRAIGSYARDAARTGFRDALTHTVAVVIALIVLAVAVAFLLPRRAREES